MARYRLIQPHSPYTVGTILEKEVPTGRLFSIELPTARRLAELGVMERLDAQEPVTPQEEPGWSEQAARPLSEQSAPSPAPAPRSSGTGKRKV
jgi:hypothetical protein